MSKLALGEHDNSIEDDLNGQVGEMCEPIEEPRGEASTCATPSRTSPLTRNGSSSRGTIDVTHALVDDGLEQIVYAALCNVRGFLYCMHNAYVIALTCPTHVC